MSKEQIKTYLDRYKWLLTIEASSADNDEETRKEFQNELNELIQFLEEYE